MPENGIFYPSASVLQSLHTSTHPSNFEYCSSSGIVNSMALFALPAAVTAPLKTLSKFFIVMAMAAVGFNTNIVDLVKKGGKPIALGFCCWVGIACMSLGMQHVLGIW